MKFRNLFLRTKKQTQIKTQTQLPLKNQTQAGFALIEVLVGLAVLSIALIAEWFLPFHYEKDEITHYGLEVSSLRDDEKLSLLKTKRDHYFWVTKFKPDWIEDSREVNIQQTWIFYQPINLILQTSPNGQLIPVQLTFQSFKVLVLLLFLLPSAAFIFRRKTSWYTVLYYLSLVLSPTVMVLFLVQNNHLFHFLTLGFF
jgi:prepilin-type N-terminal cleavage/methylation domain-containing protein